MSPSTRSFSNLKVAKFKLRAKRKIIAKMAEYVKMLLHLHSQRSHYFLCCGDFGHKTYQSLHDTPQTNHFQCDRQKTQMRFAPKNGGKAVKPLCLEEGLYSELTSFVVLKEQIWNQFRFTSKCCVLLASYMYYHNLSRFTIFSNFSIFLNNLSNFSAISFTIFSNFSIFLNNLSNFSISSF